MSKYFSFTVTAQGVYQGDELVDINVSWNNKTVPLLGAGGLTREAQILPSTEKICSLFIQKTDHPSGLQADGKKSFSHLPVFIGSGVGHALSTFLQQLEAYGLDTPVAVVDKEEAILSITQLKTSLTACPQVTWITDTSPQDVLHKLTKWQSTHGGKELFPIMNPFYLRLDRDFYYQIVSACEASRKKSFWKEVEYPKFASKKPRILLLTSKYFLIGEIVSACQRLNIPYTLLTVPTGEVGQSHFVEELLHKIVSFKPDFAFTINHLGVDREGVLTSLLEEIKLPLASWFVDNPHLILHMYQGLATKWTTLFTWDNDNLLSLQKLGFSHVHYLPLGTDITRFCLKSCEEKNSLWKTDISFVGNSMVSKVQARKKFGRFPNKLIATYQKVAADFSESNERSVRDFLKTVYPDLTSVYDTLVTPERKLAYEAMLTWEATLQYRLSCVKAILPFSPLIVGDTGWKELLPQSGHWRYHKELNYYNDLPLFYPCSKINFNCTSKQMKGAVNQRIFDVPATGAFILTDFREQITNLFEPDKEVVCYHSFAEAEELAQKYLCDAKARREVADAARKRILAEHTYDHRIQTVIEQMRKTYL